VGQEIGGKENPKKEDLATEIGSKTKDSPGHLFGSAKSLRSSKWLMIAMVPLV
jgi:hypothetical protein